MADTGVDRRSCPGCGHAHRRSRLARWLRLPTFCRAHDEGHESGWPSECGCRDRFHDGDG